MNIEQAKQSNQHAVVIGGSIAGLLAARVLSDHFEQVTVIERDELTDDAEPRKGVPQGRHVHLLQAGGAVVLMELFPDLFPMLSSSDFCLYRFGVRKAPFPIPRQVLSYSRPFLE